MQKQSNNHLLIAVLMLTIAIDVMGIGLVFPVIPELMMAKQSPFFVPTTADSIRNFYYGLSMALWPLGIFVGSAIIGKLSDFHGRKRMIIICLIGAIIAYLLSVLSFACGSLSLFIISRFICGFFGGSFGIAQAVILDVSPANKRIRNLSLITLAASVGFVLGPLVTTIVGMLSQTQIQAMSLPFWFGAFLAKINLISVYGLLPETYKQNMHRQKLKIISLIFSFRVMFVDRRVLILAISFLLLQIGWGYYAQTLPLVLAHIFNFTQTAIGFVFVIMSLGFAASTLCVQKIVLKRLSSAKAMFMTALLIGGIISVCSIWITPKSMVFSAFSAHC